MEQVGVGCMGGVGLRVIMEVMAIQILLFLGEVPTLHCTAWDRAMTMAMEATRTHLTLLLRYDFFFTFVCLFVYYSETPAFNVN